MWRIGSDLDEIVMPAFLDTQHFPQLWLCLQVEIFRAAAAKNNNTVACGLKHDCGCLIDICQWVKCE